MKASFWHRRYAIQLGRRYVSAAAGVILVGVLGYSKINQINSVFAQALPSPQQETPTPGKLGTLKVDAGVVAANTKFGFKLFSQLLKQDRSQNIFVSPVSMAIALAIIYNGASGKTQQAMAETLELQGISLQDVNSANATLLTALANSDSQVQLTIANSLWVKQGYALQPDFIQTNQNFYTAKVTNLNFSDPNAPTTINNWVNQTTNGKINRIVEQINPNDMLFLLNAVYFKGKWKKEFDQQQTVDSPFYLLTGEQKQLPMMSQSDKYKYYETQKFQAVSLPYGDDGRFSFYVFLPKQNSSLSNFYQDLNAANWEKWMSQFSQRQGLVRLPRLKMDYDFKLNDTLKSLGMEVAFTEQADFSRMGDDLAISEVKHKTFVEVNEAGTEAAAVTSGTISLVSAMVENEPFQMIVNRPFFCAIRDNQTKTVLFMGSIVEP